jgi:hypothetical protein
MNKKEKNEIAKLKKIISDLLNIYVININENGEPKTTISDIIKIIDDAKKAIKK